MAISIVGQSAPVVVTATGSANVPVPAGTVIGDHHYIIMDLKRSGGTAGVPVFTSGTAETQPLWWYYYWINEGDITATGGGLCVFECTYTTTPLTSVPVTFTTSDVHCIIKSVTFRGAKLNYGRSWFGDLLGVYYSSNAPHPYTIPATAAEFDGTFFLTAYATTGVSITLPGEQNTLMTYSYSGPPQMELAIGHQTVATHGPVAAQQLTHDSNSLAVVQISLVPAGSTSIYLDYWQTPVTNLTWNVSPSEIIFDNSGPYTYLIRSSNTVRKINRNTLSVEATFNFGALGYSTDFWPACEQDDNYLYIGLGDSPYTDNRDFTYIKVQKSDLSIVYTAAAAGTGNQITQGPFSLRLGNGDGKIYAVCSGTSAANSGFPYRLCSWNVSNGTLADNTGIPGPAFASSNPDTSFFGWSSIAIDTSNNVWVFGGDSNTSTSLTYPVIVAKMVSGSFTLTYVRALGPWHNDDSDKSLAFYDQSSDSIFLMEASTEIENAWRSSISRLSQVGASWVYQDKNYNGRYINEMSSVGINHNGIRPLFGTRSVFVPISQYGWSYASGWAPGSVVQYNFLTGAVVREIHLPDAYLHAANPVLSPEGKLWMVAVNATTSPSFTEDLLVLDVTTALDAAGEGNNANPDGGGSDGGLRITQQAVEVLNNLPIQILIERGPGPSVSDNDGLVFRSGIRLRVGGNPSAERWLRLRNKKLIYLVTLTLKYVSGSSILTEKLRLSNHAFNTKATEDPPNTEFISVLRDEDIPSLKQELSEVLYGLSIPTIGKIVINNADGQFDPKLPLSGYVWEGGDAEVKLTGDRSDLELTNAITIFTGKMGKLTYSDNSISIEVVSRAGELQKKKVPNTSFKGVNGEDILEPVAYGFVYNLTPYLKDEVEFTYKISGHELEDILAVYDNGVLLSSGQYTKDLVNGEFTLVAVPSGLITCDVAGKKILGEFSSRRADFIYDLLTSYGGLDDSEIDSTSVDFLAIEVPGDSGIYITQETPILEVALALLRPILGFLYFTRSGIATIGKFANLSDDSLVSLTLTPSEIFPQGDAESDASAAGDILTISQSDTLISKAVLLYNHNWTVFTEEQLGAADPINPNTAAGQIRRDWLKKEALRAEIELSGPTIGRSLYESAEDMEPLESYFIDEADARTAAQNWLDIYGVQRFLISVRCATMAYNASLHNTIELDYDVLDEDTGGRRSRWFNDKITRSVAYEENYGDNVINMLLFI